jgi:hypothetical protein
MNKSNQNYMKEMMTGLLNWIKKLGDELLQLIQKI